MLVKGLMTQMSGSLGGITAAHAKGGTYLRARTIPVNPASAYQGQVRNAVTQLAQAWGQSLTPAQRAAWDLYGANVTTTNRTGDVINLSGQQWFIATNTPRLQAVSKLSASLTVVEDAPVIFDRGDPGSLTIDSIGEAGGISITVGGSPDWAADADAIAFVYVGRPIGAGRNFFAGPYRLALAEPGNVVPVTSLDLDDVTLTNEAWTITEGQAVAVAVAVQQADGRLSSRIRLGPAPVDA